VAKSISTGITNDSRAVAPGLAGSNGHSITLNEIRLRAYGKWRAAGMPDGDSLRFWLEAEQELLQEKEIRLAPAASAADLPEKQNGRMDYSKGGIKVLSEVTSVLSGANS
jgi:Protein of unknown function (DUF2934)